MGERPMRDCGRRFIRREPPSIMRQLAVIPDVELALWNDSPNFCRAQNSIRIAPSVDSPRMTIDHTLTRSIQSAAHSLNVPKDVANAKISSPRHARGPAPRFPHRDQQP